jgi:hypothetical protein
MLAYLCLSLVYDLSGSKTTNNSDTPSCLVSKMYRFFDNDLITKIKTRGWVGCVITNKKTRLAYLTRASLWSSVRGVVNRDYTKGRTQERLWLTTA